ncbi:tRNA pseudouridine(13) synthase TruD [Candidatus Micrarchaeota archaeon]|nr:tRNA pseudouridine(13) synthase TruD [Candidatus Micrarchaeota archaeon]
MFRAQNPSEFIVEEILSDGTVLEIDKPIDLGKPEDQGLERDYFTHFVLQKTDWNTMQALGSLAHRLNVKPGRLNFAGTKDKKAVTVQRCSAFAVEPQRILSANVKDVVVLGAWKAKEKMRLGDLGGNRFTITLTKENTGATVDAERVQENVEASKYTMKNLFGAQRFGSLRQNTATVGKHVVAGNLESAAWEYLAGEGPEPENFASVRKKLREEKDFAAAQTYFPHPLRYEKQMLAHLAVTSTDFGGSLRRLPRNLQLMFVHAFQAELFNEYVAENEGDYSCPSNPLGFPDVQKAVPGSELEWPCAHVIGYDVELSESEGAFLEEKGVDASAFKLKSMPELSAKGVLRPTRVPLKDFQIVSEEPLVVRFSLPSGSYATTALDVLLQQENLNSQAS